MNNNYVPKKEILEKYANVLVNFALNSCSGIKPSQRCFIKAPECSKPLIKEVYIAVLKAGAIPIVQMYPDNFSKIFYELASDEQLKSFPKHFTEGSILDADCNIHLIAETDKYELKDIDPKKIMTRQKAYEPFYNIRKDREKKGLFSWTLCLYGTDHMATEVGMSPEEYWDEIINACYLNEDDPVQEWKTLMVQIDEIKDKLNNLEIDKLHIEAEETDLWIKIGPSRKWLGGSGHNIPSYEIFISPDCRGTEGKIYFNYPLFRTGNKMTDIRLEFKDGKIINATASEGEEFLKEMISVKNADMIGEYSLTDSRMSRIKRLMGETLYDENTGGEFGNTHLAIGNAYTESYPGDEDSLTDKDWENLGYNNSVIHTDIIATTNRTVTAHLADGSTKIIYKDGQFQV